MPHKRVRKLPPIDQVTPIMVDATTLGPPNLEPRGGTLLVLLADAEGGELLTALMVRRRDLETKLQTSPDLKEYWERSLVHINNLIHRFTGKDNY